MHRPADLTIPRSRELLACFSGMRADEDFVLGAAGRLCRHHAEQWRVEDLARASAGDDRELAQAKRRIDRMNVRRAGLVDELDAWFSKHMNPHPGVPLHTETVGSVIDRLCIAWVRAENLAHTAGGRHRAGLARRQLNELARAYDLLLDEVWAGHRRVPDWQALKSYGEARLEQ